MNHHSLLLGVALLWSSALSQAGEALTLSPAQIESLGLRFAPPAQAQTASGAAWPGKVTLPPDGHEQLVAPLPGRVTRVHASAGGTVKAEQPLLTIYSPALVQLVQDYQRARASEDLARQTLAREQRLVKEGIGVERRVREAEIALRQASAETRGLAARLGLAGIAPDRLPGNGTALSEQHCREQCRDASRPPEGGIQGWIPQLTLRAPRDGALLMLSASPGTWLDEGEAAAELAYTDRRWVEAEVPLEQATKLSPGQSVQVQPGDLAGKALAVGLTADAQRQTVQVRIELPQGSALRPGQRVQVRFAEDGKVWQVPPSAIVRIGGQDRVFVQRGDGIIPIPVVQRGSAGDAVLVAGELKADDRVVHQGAIALKAAWQARDEAK
ncbi:MAG: efflux RND transporter periplasmic adaptor subunit [Pseudomonadota bacterium]